MKSLDNLRTELQACDEANARPTRAFMRRIADEIEAEIAERYMELPLDMDGVPIHVGNVVEFGENRNQGIVKALNEHMVIATHVDDGCTNYAKHGLLWGAESCRHVKPRTLEDVLCLALSDVSCMGDGINRPFDPTEKYVQDLAAEIRELMGVER